MKRFFQLFITFGIFISTSKAQIIINGPKPYNPYSSGSKNAISISYGSLFWNDVKEVDLRGYSESLASLHDYKWNKNLKNLLFNMSLRLGFEKGISDKFSIKTVMVAGKLYTGASLRTDLLVTEKSKVFQVATYGNLILSRPEKKFKVHLMFGPEFMLVNKNAIIAEYVLKQGDVPAEYNQKETVFEVGVTTGLGFSYDISQHIGLFTNGLIGVSLPGGGWKLNGSGLGLQYIF